MPASHASRCSASALALAALSLALQQFVRVRNASLQCLAASPLQVATVEEQDAEYTFDLVTRPDVNWDGSEIPEGQRDQ